MAFKQNLGNGGPCEEGGHLGACHMVVRTEPRILGRVTADGDTRLRQRCDVILEDMPMLSVKLVEPRPGFPGRR